MPRYFLYRGDGDRRHGEHEGSRQDGAIALIYFEVVSTLALIIGLCVVNLLQPGVGMNVDPSLDASAISAYAEQAQSQGIVAFLLDVIPPA